MSDEIEIRGYDFHCHIDLYPDPAAMIAQCTADRIVTLAVTTTPKAWPHNQKLAKSSRYVRASPGLHPELVGERYQEIELLDEYVKESRLVGEVGLDGSPQHRKTWGRQEEVFIRALKCAQTLGGRVISIHSRRAASEVVKLIAEYTTADRTLCILHWYSGSIPTARRAAELGCYFSVNHRMLARDSGLALVQSLPQDRLLTETDAPFTRQHERISIPGDVVGTAERLAEMRNLSVPDMGRVLAANSRRVFRFAEIQL